MPALNPTEFIGTATFLGVVNNREAKLGSDPLSSIHAEFSGFANESHAGLTRESDSRVLQQYPRGTEIRNTRQFSILSTEDLAEIAKIMGLDQIDPIWLGASMVIEGIPDFTLIPPSSRLQFDGGATLTVDMENRPCVLPATEINAAHPGFGTLFKPAAKGRRGVTGWVEREGVINLGDRVQLHVPNQPAWPHLQIQT